MGERGHAVALLQAALIMRHYKLPITLAKGNGTPDGVFGEETDTAVRAFQTDQKLKPDGIAGHKTISALDALLPAAGPIKPPKLPKAGLLL